MNNAHRHLAATVAAAVIVLAACSASDSEPAPLDTEAPTTTAEPPPTEAPTTPAPTTTETTVPDTAVTIVVTTTEPPPETTTTTTTTPPLTDAELIAEIEADLNENNDALLAAGADPGSPEAAAIIEDRYAGGSQANFRSAFDDLIDQGLVLADNPLVEPSIEVLEIVEHTPNTATIRDTATIRVCVIDPVVVRTAPNAEFPDGVIVNDRISRYVNQIGVIFNGTRWISEGGFAIEETPLTDPREATCDGL